MCSVLINNLIHNKIMPYIIGQVETNYSFLTLIIIKLGTNNIFIAITTQNCKIIPYKGMYINCLTKNWLKYMYSYF